MKYSKNLDSITRNFLLFTVFGLILIGCTTQQQVAQQVEPFNPDTLMGDWQGIIESEGQVRNLCAQVIAYDSGQYKINLMNEFDTRDPLLAELEGMRDGAKVDIKGKATGGAEWLGVIEGQSFTGTVSGEKTGTFKLDKIERISPTLGKKAPEGAKILFEGSNLDQWQHPEDMKGYVNLNRLVNKNECVVYLQAEVMSEKDQQAILLCGSDDGIKVWLNDKIVHALNKERGAVPDDDTVNVNLKKGWNKLLLKINNGDGGFGVLARLVDKDFEMLPSISEKNYLSSAKEETRKFLKENNGFLTLWELSGPFKKDDLKSAHLFDVAFQPETDPTKAGWSPVDIHNFDYSVNWQIVGQAMQVKPSSGSIMTREKFNDFSLHVEFRSPFMPYAKGQKRGNSGVYVQGRYEVQVLDSYGLEGKDNECGGIYKVARPNVNMCAPPAQWQTYDIEFRAARYDKRGNKRENPVMTVVHNGVTIHENLEIPVPTAGGLDKDMSKPGPIFLQDHSDLVQYRNIWLVEK